MSLRVLQVGLGPIGIGIARRAHGSVGLRLVGAVDPKDGLPGRDLGEVLGVGTLGVAIYDSIGAALEQLRPDAALHATGSHLEGVAGQLIELVSAGVAVVSTCEELSYPFHRHPALSRRLDALARESGVALLGTGVNPGFVMDKLVVTLLAACDEVRRVRVRRVLDAARRREPFQRKVGGGLSPAGFESRRRAGTLGHVGLVESALMLADAIGIHAPRTVRETLAPVIAERAVRSEFLRVEPGQVAGIDQTAAIEAEGEERVRMELRMFLGAPRSEDAVTIEGKPRLELAISTGVPGDEATAAIVVHCAPLLPALAPGLRTMLDVPLRPAAWS